MVVGYDYGCPEVCEALERRAGCDAAIDGHEQVGNPAVKAAGHGGVGKPIAFRAQRNEWADAAAHGAYGRDEDGGGGYAVGVEVAEDDDVPCPVYGFREPRRCFAYSWKFKRRGDVGQARREESLQGGLVARGLREAQCD